MFLDRDVAEITFWVCILISASFYIAKLVVSVQIKTLSRQYKKWEEYIDDEQNPEFKMIVWTMWVNTFNKKELYISLDRSLYFCSLLFWFASIIIYFFALNQ